MFRPSSLSFVRCAALAVLGCTGVAHAAVDAFVKNSVPTARCIQVQTQESQFGYPVTRNVAVAPRAIASIGSVFNNAYIVWTAFTSADCSTGQIKQGPVVWAPPKNGSWTFEAK